MRCAAEDWRPGGAFPPPDHGQGYTRTGRDKGPAHERPGPILASPAVHLDPATLAAPAGPSGLLSTPGPRSNT
eukprot:9851252-Alexandrium_andersonii.AAC.1